MRIQINNGSVSQSDKSPRREPSEISLDQQVIFFDPSEEDVLDALIEKPLNNLVETINSIAVLEKSVFPLLELPARASYFIENSNEKLERTKNSLNVLISKCFSELNPFLDKYREYSYLILSTENKVWKDFVGIKKKDQLVF